MTKIGSATLELRGDASHFAAEMDRASSKFKSVGRRMQGIGRTLTTRVTLPIVAMGVAAGKAAADFETAMTGVAKTVDAPASEIARLGEEFQALSEEIPISANELARIGELAGQLGVETRNILSFTETIAGIGVATNLSVEQAATSLARMSNIMGTSTTDVDRLGATIVDLGNNLATTEAEITDFALRIAGAGEIAGLAESDVLAIGGALSSVGIRAEAGGTAVQKALIQMNTAVAQGNEELAVFAETAGMTATQFAEQWENEPVRAFQAFIEGLGTAGDDASTILESLFSNNQRLTRAFLGLANAGDLLGNAIDRGTEAWSENTALTEETAKFYDRLAARFKILRNTLTNVAAELGTALMPVFDSVISAAGRFLNMLRDLNPTVIKWGLALAGVAAAIGPILIAAGALTAAVGALLPVFAALSGPVGLVIAGVVAAGAAFVTWREEITAFLSGALEKLKPTISAVMSVLKAFGGLVMEVAGPILKPLATVLGAVVAGSFMALVEVLNLTVVPALKLVAFTLTLMTDAFAAAKEPVRGAMQGVADFVAGAVDKVLGFIASMIAGIREAFSAGFQAAIEPLRAGIETVKGWFGGLKDFVVGNSVIPEMVDGVDSEMVRLHRLMTGQVSSFTAETAAMFVDMADKAERAAVRVRRAFEDIETLERRFRVPDFSAIGGRAFAGGTIADTPAAERVKKIGAPNVQIPDLASLTPEQRQKFIEGVPFEELTGKIKSFGKKTKELLFGVGEDMITGLIQGTLDMGDILKRFLIGFASRFILGPLASALRIGSPSKVTETFGRQLGAGFVAGMKRMEPAVKSAALGLASAAAVSLQPPSLSTGAVQAPRSTSTLGTPSAASQTREQSMPDIVIEALFDPHREAQSAGGQVFIREGTTNARRQGFR